MVTVADPTAHNWGRCWSGWSTRTYQPTYWPLNTGWRPQRLPAWSPTWRLRVRDPQPDACTEALVYGRLSTVSTCFAASRERSVAVPCRPSVFRTAKQGSEGQYMATTCGGTCTGDVAPCHIYRQWIETPTCRQVTLSLAHPWCTMQLHRQARRARRSSGGGAWSGRGPRTWRAACRCCALSWSAASGPCATCPPAPTSAPSVGDSLV